MERLTATEIMVILDTLRGSLTIQNAPALRLWNFSKEGRKKVLEHLGDILDRMSLGVGIDR